MHEFDIASIVIVLVNAPVEEVDVDVVHLGVVELVDAELVAQAMGFVKQEICESCVL